MSEPPGRSTEISLPMGLAGTLELPPAPRGAVVFAHGSGSGRFSPRNRQVAAALREAGFATLLFDLLTEAEAADRRKVFDIPLLATRLDEAIAAVAQEAPVLRIGLFGASTGAAAALVSAAANPLVCAVVSRGGRPDLAGERCLARVVAPTLLIVGGADAEVLALNEQARAHLAGPNELAVIPGATHLFEEPGTLEEVARQAAAWFARWLREAKDVRA